MADSRYAGEAGLQAVFGQIKAAMAEKQDKINDMGLSHNDYSNEEKQKNAQNASDIVELNSDIDDIIEKMDGDATTYPYADVITIEDAIPANLADCTVKIEPVQDLHGYDHPWVGGANVNLLPSLVPGTYEKDGIIVTVDNNGNMNISGTKTASAAVTINVPLTSPIDISANYYLHIRNDVSDSNVVTMGITFSGTNRIAVMSDMQGVQNCVVYIASVATLNINARLSIEKTNNVTDWSPYENICPITGHTEASVQDEGKNLLDIPDKTLSSSGWAIEQYSPISVKAGTYTLSYDFSGTANSSSLVFYDENKVEIARGNATSTINGRNTSKVVLPQKAYYFNMYSNAVGTYTNFMFESGEDATPYVPYAGKTYTISLGDTIYGGTVRIDSNGNTVMDVDRAIAALSSMDFAYNSNNKLFYSTNGTGIPDAKSYSGYANAICSAYFENNVQGSLMVNGGFKVQDGAVYVKDLAYDDTSAFETAVANVTICYELATPFTVQLTPQQIQLLKGYNTLTASTGQISVTVNGVSGAIGQVQEQVNELAEKVAPIPIIRKGTVNFTNLAVDNVFSSDIAFDTPMPNADYTVTASASGTTVAVCNVGNRTVNGFTVYVRNIGTAEIGGAVMWQVIG